MKRRPENPWERQPRESPQAWEAFNRYREMGAQRSIRKVAESLGKSEGLLNRWSMRWAWVNRCAEWDEHLAAVARAAEAAERERMAKRHADIGRGLQNEAIRELQARERMWREFAEGTGPQPPALDPHQVRLWAQAGVTIERLARGEATERHEIAPTRERGVSPGDARDEILRKILSDPDVAAAADTLAAAMEGVAGVDGGEADGGDEEAVAPPSPPR